MKKLLIIGILALAFGSSLTFADEVECPSGTRWNPSTQSCDAESASGGVRG